MDTGGIRHEVRNGVVVDAVGVGAGLPFDEETQTMDDFFDRAIAIAREDPDELRITYDETHHFIRSLDVIREPRTTSGRSRDRIAG